MYRRKTLNFVRHKPIGFRHIPPLLGLLAAFVLAYSQLPFIQTHLGWRVDAALTALRTLVRPIGLMPTPVQADSGLPAAPTATASLAPASTPTPQTPPAPAPPVSTPTVEPPTPTPLPLPQKVSLPAPAYERQDWNNCGPATLSMHLRFYGWQGNQNNISDKIKPLRADRNVNIDELVSYVNSESGSYRALFRVGGDLELLKRLLAAGVPVTIEETFYLSESFWFNDDRWSGHYLLLTGYDDAAQTFTAQDSFVGADRQVSYRELDRNWQSFNRAFLLVYPPEQESQIQALLGDLWQMDGARQRALQTARAESEASPGNAFAWFNLGSNLVYFDRYSEAATAYDTARQIGLPQRMLRYQFGPFLAYFHAGRNDDLLALTEYALKVTPNSEEALLWRGWGLYRAGKREEAIVQFQKALQEHPGYADAKYALDFVIKN
jgi:tetratricopeptide (TPR) repeat protein